MTVSHTTNGRFLPISVQRAAVKGPTTSSRNQFIREIRLLLALVLLVGTAHGAFSNWTDVSDDESSQTREDSGPRLLLNQKPTLEEANRLVNLHIACYACAEIDAPNCFECRGSGYIKRSFITQIGATRQVHSGDKSGLAIRARRKNSRRRLVTDDSDSEWVAATVVTPPSKDDTEVIVLFLESTEEEKIPVENTRVYDSETLTRLETRVQERLDALDEKPDENADEEKRNPDHRILTVRESDQQRELLQDTNTHICCLRNAKWSNVSDAIIGVTLACAALNRAIGNFDAEVWPSSGGLLPTISDCLGPVRYVAFSPMILAGVMRTLDSWLGTYSKMCALAGDESVKVLGCCPFSVKKKWCARGSSFWQTLGSAALCVTTFFGTGQPNGHNDIHNYSSITVFGAIIVNATCLIHLFENVEEGKYPCIRRWLKRLVMVAVPMIAALALANYAMPPDRAPTTGYAICDDWYKEGGPSGRVRPFGSLEYPQGNWYPESEAVLCDSLPFGDKMTAMKMHAAFDDADAQAGGGISRADFFYSRGECINEHAEFIYETDEYCTKGTGIRDTQERCEATESITPGTMCHWHPEYHDRGVSRYPSDPKVPHPGKVLCYFVFALTEWVSVGMQIWTSKKTTNALHSKKKGFTFFKCCSRERNAPENDPGPTAAAAPESENFFQKWVRKLNCFGPTRELSGSSESLERNPSLRAAIPSGAEEPSTDDPTNV